MCVCVQCIGVFEKQIRVRGGRTYGRTDGRASSLQQTSEGRDRARLQRFVGPHLLSFIQPSANNLEGVFNATETIRRPVLA